MGQRSTRTKKDFAFYKEGDPENEVIFWVLIKKQNISSVVKDICDRLNEELRANILVKEDRCLKEMRTLLKPKLFVLLLNQLEMNIVK